MSTPVDHCSLWFEGDWTECCRAHDESALDAPAAIALGRCVAATGHPLMGLVMVAGVLLFGGLYLAIRRRFPARKDP